MTLLLDAFWRAAAYCLRPRVILLSILPLIVVGTIAGVLGYFYWESAVAGARAAIENWQLLAPFFQWLQSIGAGSLRSALAPLLIVALAVPVTVVLALLLVALMMTPALVDLVAARRFPQLQRRHGATFWQGVATSLGCTVLALFALLVSLPLWFIPPLVLVLPPLIWGWLAYRVMGFDVLAEHASADERRIVLREHRGRLLLIGVVTGYFSAAPSLVWALGAIALVFAPLHVFVAVWIYTFVFAFSALWFTHYALAALAALRARPPGIGSGARAAPGPTGRGEILFDPPRRAN
jgi:hypothetical protein